MIGRRTGLGTGLAWIVAGVVAAGTATGAAAQDKVRVGLAVGGFTPYAPVYAAQELGIYKAKNLDVELTVYRGGGAAQEAVAAGAADIISFFPPGVAIGISKGVKQKIIAGAATVMFAVLLLSAAVSLDSAIRLAGSTVAVKFDGS